MTDNAVPHFPVVVGNVYQETGNGTVIRRGDQDFDAVTGVAMVLADGDVRRFGAVECHVHISTASDEIAPR